MATRNARNVEETLHAICVETPKKRLLHVWQVAQIVVEERIKRVGKILRVMKSGKRSGKERKKKMKVKNRLNLE